MGGVSDDRAARLVLARIAEPGDRALGAAVAEHGAGVVLDAVRRGSSGLSGERHYRVRLADTDPVEMSARLAACGGRFCVPGDGEWPTQLADLGPAEPLGLFVRGGDLRLAAVRSVAVVGARAASQYGLHVATDLAADLASRGWVVASGAAYGIDAAAHRGALVSGGPTVAVLACGVDVAYPRGHSALLERLASGEGVLVSELPPGSTPTRPRFLTRNRVIAALSRGTVVVEAAHRSGALNTAATAAALGRFVMAVPGPVTSPMSAGAHRLLQSDPSCRLVTGADDVVEQVGSIGELAPEPGRPVRVRDGLDPTTQRVLEAVPVHRPHPTGRVSHDAGLHLDVVTGALHRLLLAGLVDHLRDGWRQTAAAQGGR
jgi:DNA processing protein